MIKSTKNFDWLKIKRFLKFTPLSKMHSITRALLGVIENDMTLNFGVLCSELFSFFVYENDR